MLEGWAGKALITELAPEYGLSSLQPCDLRFNWDILQGFETQLWKHAIETHKPLLVVMPIHCTPWCIFNNNCNYKNRPEELMAWRDSERPGIKLAAWTCRTQAAGGRYYLLENPPTSQLKRQPEFQPIRDILSRMSGIGDMGAYGAMGKQLPIIQPMQFFCNDVGLQLMRRSKPLLLPEAKSTLKSSVAKSSGGFSPRPSRDSETISTPSMSPTGILSHMDAMSGPVQYGQWKQSLPLKTSAGTMNPGKE